MSPLPPLGCAMCAASDAAPLGVLLPLLLLVPYLVAWLVLRAARNLAARERRP